METKVRASARASVADAKVIAKPAIKINVVLFMIFSFPTIQLPRTYDAVSPPNDEQQINNSPSPVSTKCSSPLST
jgi:hypothetical protein